MVGLSLLSKNSRQDGLEFAFKAMDRDSDSRISYEEFALLLNQLGFAESEVESMFKASDTNNDGYIDFGTSIFSMHTPNWIGR